MSSTSRTWRQHDERVMFVRGIASWTVVVAFVGMVAFGIFFWTTPVPRWAAWAALVDMLTVLGAAMTYLMAKNTPTRQETLDHLKQIADRGRWAQGVLDELPRKPNPPPDGP